MKIKPPRLREGDTVGVVSPSAPITPDLQEQLDRGIATLEGFGLRVKLAPHALDRHFYSAGRAAERIADFNRMWADPEVAMVLMSQGGQSANHLLEGLEFDLFGRNPKIFSGISDGTTLLTAISKRSGIVTFHGPDLLWTFGLPMSPPFEQNVRSVLMDGWYGAIPSTTLTPVREGRASGPLHGGHINILILTMLAGYAPDLRGAILFLEGTESIDRLDRQFTALRLRGVFDQIAGLVIGHFEGHDEVGPASYRTPAEMVLEVTQDYDFPILQLDELGHHVENLVFPIGVTATLDTTTPSLHLDEPAVS
jgi:muramoyltetrapeptide carboxypeptidase